jgi:hypothetical protein
MLSCPGWFSLFPLFCLFCSPSRRFGRIFRIGRLVLHDFRLQINDELFNKLVAHRVGLPTCFVHPFLNALSNGYTTFR